MGQPIVTPLGNRVIAELDIGEYRRMGPAEREMLGHALDLMLGHEPDAGRVEELAVLVEAELAAR